MKELQDKDVHQKNKNVHHKSKNVFVESKLSSFYLSEVSLEKKSPVISLKGFRQNLTNLSNCP